MIRSILINRKRLKAKKRFYAFVLWNSDSGNFGLLSPKFLLFEAEWNVQHKSIQTSFLLLIFFSYIPTKRIIAPIYELYSIFVCLSSAFYSILNMFLSMSNPKSRHRTGKGSLCMIILLNTLFLTYFFQSSLLCFLCSCDIDFLWAFDTFY